MAYPPLLFPWLPLRLYALGLVPSFLSLPFPRVCAARALVRYCCRALALLFPFFFPSRGRFSCCWTPLSGICGGGVVRYALGSCSARCLAFLRDKMMHWVIRVIRVIRVIFRPSPGAVRHGLTPVAVCTYRIENNAPDADVPRRRRRNRSCIAR